MQEMRVQSLSHEDPLEKGNVTTPGFLPGESHGQRSLVGYNQWSCKDLAMTEWRTLFTFSLFHKNLETEYKICLSIKKKKGRNALSTTLLTLQGFFLAFPGQSCMGNEIIYVYKLILGFSGGSDGKESACDVGDLDSIPGLGRSPGEGNGYLLQYSCLENPMDRGAWRAIVHGVSKSWTHLRDQHAYINVSKGKLPVSA